MQTTLNIIGVLLIAILLQLLYIGSEIKSAADKIIAHVGGKVEDCLAEVNESVVDVETAVRAVETAVETLKD